tara:strand:- start:394093 stop:395100 length:1008 start_codon:yes stop_codon:yes gene_type:complete
MSLLAVSPKNTLKAYSGGLALSALIAALSKLLSIQFGLPVMLVCLISGLVLGRFFTQGFWQSGINFTSKTVLRLGVILIGARFVFSDLNALGIQTIALIIAATIGVIILSILASKKLKLDKSLGLIMGGATAICGASAAMAIAALLPHDKHTEKNTAAAVLSVTAIGTLAMITYPFIISALHLTDQQAAILIGGTIHDVAQVVGAGYSLSHEIGDQAVLIKLIRVFMLVPVLLGLAVYIHYSHSRSASQSDPKPQFKFPLFLIGFVALLAINGLGYIPPATTDALKQISHFMLIMAITAVGLKTPIKAIRSLGWKPLCLVGLNSFALIVIYALYI